jgi:hypothetical protein
MMIAYKFLRAERIGPFSGVQWPEPGVWLEASGELAACRGSVHACRVSDLPWWLNDELWEVEVGGSVQAAEHKLIAPSGRLRARVAGWTPACAQAYADACTWRARDRVQRALEQARDGDAGRLAACATLDELEAVATELSGRDSPESRALALTAAAAECARDGEHATSAYVAAHVAAELGGAEDHAAERAAQARWLAETLELRED